MRNRGIIGTLRNSFMGWDKASGSMKDGAFYDDAIRRRALDAKSDEALFFELATEDLVQAAELFRPVHDATGGVDSWVSLEGSPLLADDTSGRVKAAVLHARAERPNIFITLPGTCAGIPAIEEPIFAGVPVNVTLLFSREHYIAAAEAYMRGVERRISADRDPRVASVASVFVSRWDVAVKDKVRTRSATALALPLPCECTMLTASCWRRRTGRSPPLAGPYRSACCGAAPRPRILRPRTASTSKRWRLRIPSTPCPRRRCSPSPIIGR